MRSTLQLAIAFGLLGLWGSYAPAHARDVRLALLVGNQQGWKGDTRLHYVLKGDLRPIGQVLKRIGFQVLKLENQNPQAIRKAIAQIQQRMLQSPKVSTFLFYYTGHADQKHFHMGPKSGGKPFSYSEFRGFFSKLQVTRRIAIIDACHSGEIVKVFGSEKRFRKMLKRGIPKGVRAQRTANLLRRLRPSQGHEKGLRVIGSSRFISWELRKYKASVFTYHLIRGIKGRADLDQDGRVSLDELFAFTRQQVYRDTGQRPQQYKQVIVGEPYAFAPAYRSYLRIGANVVGRLKIAVANFVWVNHKRKREALRLATVNGRGEVFLQRKQRCYHQSVQLPKGGEGQIKAGSWRAVPCRRMQRVAKGSLVLRAQSGWKPETERFLEVSVQSGYAFSGEDVRDTHQLQLGAGVRWRFLGAALTYSSGQPVGKSFHMTRLMLRLEAGLPLHFGSDRWVGFFGVYGHGGLSIQSHPQFDAKNAYTFGLGGVADISWWWTPWLGGRIGARAGVDYTPVAQSAGISFHAQIQVALLIGLLRETR